MLTLEVRINGSLVTIAGSPEMSVLSAMITAVGKLGPNSAGTNHDPTEESIDLRVGGMTAPSHGGAQEHLDWLVQKVVAGDQVSITLSESTTAEPAQSRRPVGTKDSQQRQIFEHARETYLRLREQYEDLDQGP